MRDDDVNVVAARCKQRVPRMVSDRSDGVGVVAQHLIWIGREVEVEPLNSLVVGSDLMPML